MKQLVTIIYTILFGLLQFLKDLLRNPFHMRTRRDWPGEPIKGRGPYEILPGQLSNRQLLRIDRREKDPNSRLFPDGTIVDKAGRLVNALQFIVAVENDSDANPEIDAAWAVGNVLWLGKEGARTQVIVKKSRRCSPKGKRYVLLEAVDRKKITYLEERKTPVFDLETGDNSIGVIHGSESNPGGGRDHSGGQSNCYGVALLVRPAPGPPEKSDFKEDFYPHAKAEKIIVAVLDSGIFEETDRVDKSANCSDSGQLGWNFVDDNSSPHDDHLGLHGTKVSRIIKRYASDAEILPVKVSNQNGVLDLYDVLCGLEYARTHGAKLVNASWSFTGNKNNTEETDFPLLLGAIRDLDESGVIVVAAAGNRSQYVPEANGEIAKNNAPRIYPACYSAIQCNVITVTTVVKKRIKFSVFENYSPRYVDTGVVPSVSTTLTALPEGEFTVPGFVGSYEGSSFATPIVTARVANVLSDLTGFASKGSILHRLSGFQEEDDLVNEIRNGGCYVKE